MVTFIESGDDDVRCIIGVFCVETSVKRVLLKFSEQDRDGF